MAEAAVQLCEFQRVHGELSCLRSEMHHSTYVADSQLAEISAFQNDCAILNKRRIEYSSELSSLDLSTAESEKELRSEFDNCVRTVKILRAELRESEGRIQKSVVEERMTAARGESEFEQLRLEMHAHGSAVSSNLQTHISNLTLMLGEEQEARDSHRLLVDRSWSSKLKQLQMKLQPALQRKEAMIARCRVLEEDARAAHARSEIASNENSNLMSHLEQATKEYNLSSDKLRACSSTEEQRLLDLDARVLETEQELASESATHEIAHWEQIEAIMHTRAQSEMQIADRLSHYKTQLREAIAQVHAACAEKEFKEESAANERLAKMQLADHRKLRAMQDEVASELASQQKINIESSEAWCKSKVAMLSKMRGLETQAAALRQAATHGQNKIEKLTLELRTLVDMEIPGLKYNMGKKDEALLQVREKLVSVAADSDRERQELLGKLQQEQSQAEKLQKGLVALRFALQSTQDDVGIGARYIPPYAEELQNMRSRLISARERLWALPKKEKELVNAEQNRSFLQEQIASLEANFLQIAKDRERLMEENDKLAAELRLLPNPATHRPDVSDDREKMIALENAVEKLLKQNKMLSAELERNHRGRSLVTRSMEGARTAMDFGSATNSQRMTSVPRSASDRSTDSQRNNMSSMRSKLQRQSSRESLRG